MLGGQVGLGESVRTGLNVLVDGNKVMQWYTHEDSYSPGNQISLSCTATYNATTPINTESDIEVLNYYGTQSWSTLPRGRYNMHNTEFIVDQPWKRFDLSRRSQEKNDFLVGQTRNIDRYATQSCGAYRMIGEIPSEMLQL